MALRRRRENILVGVLAVLATLGGGHAILDFLSSGGPPPVDQTPVVVGHAQLAGSFAEQYLLTYLGATSGQQERIAEFVSTPQMSLPATAKQVADPIVVHLARTYTAGNLEIWTVTVSVRTGKSATQPADTRQYYRVSVSLTEGRLRALALPALVTAPTKGPDLSLHYPTTCAPESPLGQVATGFLSAFLTGTGDVARYTTVDSGMTAMKPAPFSSVDTVTIAAEDSGCGLNGTAEHLMATINPKSDSGPAPTLSYPLTLVRADGRWQVRSIDSLPALPNPLTLGTDQDSRSGPTSSSMPPTSVRIPAPTQN
ncbi:conjugal transfer protein [Nocardia panacis]|uniref:Conjugal transfer protein n=2 Tax=Nocardia panacis TaxID=2340916 RepID=A0A3A4KUG0_9NOCA|nr:conjugal transfer protein [Nocardia panacis]